MANLTRPLTVRFPTRHYERLGNEKILESLEDNLEISEVKAIQITESSCFETVSTREAKERFFLSGVNVRDSFQ